MEEIYWITRLDSICVLIGIISGISVGFTLLCIFMYFFNRDMEGDFGDEKHTKNKEFWGGLLKWAALFLMLSSLFKIFTPSSKEALIIWGVGGTIDYIKSNEKIKELPDKVVDALDLWVNNYLENDSIK